MFNTRNFSSIVLSLFLHGTVLGAMAFMTFTNASHDVVMALDSVFSEERFQEEFEREVDVSTNVAETINFVAGSMVSNAVTVGASAGGGGAGGGGGGGDVIATSKIDGSGALKEPDFRYRPGPIAVPGLGVLGNDFGSGQISGDIGRVVGGYGAALSQITQELMRLMREEKILVCWMFDASESMEDDRKQIRDNFHKVYEELGLVTRSDARLKAAEEPILTSVFTFNANINELTPRPTSDVDAIRSSIDKIVKDEGGDEKFCGAVEAVIQKYGRVAQGQKRKLVIIMMSDESGDDGASVEEAIDRCKRVDASVYFLGRYSIFGFPYATMRWTDPKYGLTHWLTINRGPETAFAECLQFDGLHRRWDAYSSGFGPYAQVRLCRETGGVFFLLPGEEENLTGRGWETQRKYELLDMKEYTPDLTAATLYLKERDSSKFRSALSQVITRFDPINNSEYEMQETWFPNDPAVFAQRGAENFQKAVKALKSLNEAVVFLNGVQGLRDNESSMRWRAHFDLIHAQLLAYRVRLFQYILALDLHQRTKPQPKDPKNNVWTVRRVPKMLPPTPEQVKQAGVDLKELEEQEQQARQEFQQVIQNHPRTPWAQLAQRELQIGFGITMVEEFRDPRYDNIGKDIKFPKP